MHRTSESNAMLPLPSQRPWFDPSTGGVGGQDQSDVSQLSLIQENILVSVKYILLIC